LIEILGLVPQKIPRVKEQVIFRYSEKASKNGPPSTKNSTLLSSFVAISENLNFDKYLEN
jgi:hypothetical protein